MAGPLVLNIQKYAIHDGAGIRTTVFFKGCPLSCLWCHNPESQRYPRELMFHQDRCAGCGECAQACPSGAAMPPDRGLRGHLRPRRAGVGRRALGGPGPGPGPGEGPDVL